MSAALSSCACSSSRSTDSAVSAATLVASATASSARAAVSRSPRARASRIFVSSSSMCFEHAAMMSSRSLSSARMVSIFTLCSTLRLSTVRKFRTSPSSVPSAAVSSTRFSL